MKMLFKQHIAAGLVAIGIVAPIAWMAMDRDVPYIRSGGEMIPPNPQKGDAVEIKWNIISKKACPQASDRSIKKFIIIVRTGRSIPFDPVPGVVGGNKNEINRTNIKTPFAIPTDIEAGPARYRSEACFACNPIQHFFPVCITEPEIPFEIVEKTK